ncbi:MAG: molybdopterin-guanine dinucleotide biosynthesis protein B [Candidatus Thorarchaeota archaeon SMTZ1-45]|nr:MAG: hypothetical protein AM325_02025 [Candidatus Thorarchaeota archaeon SMTZ1-45]
MRVFAVSGYSGAGKTSLVEAIVRSLVMSGHSVATIKSSLHKAGPNRGTDTWKHMQAGASEVVFLGPSKKTTRFRERIGSEELSRLTKYDFLIVEGMKSVDIPKFWCVGDSEIDPNDIPVNTQAIVSWSVRRSDVNGGIRIISADNIHELVDIVKNKSVNLMDIE